MALELTVVDAFADVPFRGNPAAVAIVSRFPDESYMQAVAAELNLSETSFVADGPDGARSLRWFTPSVEVDLCGHATLAAAHLLGGTARFHTRSGVLACTRSDDGWIAMDLPADPPEEAPVPGGVALPGLHWYGRGRQFGLAVVESAARVRDLVPDLVAIAGAEPHGLIVTAAGDTDEVDCVSRVFAPAVGIPEDPVTGSAHCTLAGYWGDRLGVDALVGEQASRRGGVVRMKRGGGRVAVSGRAVTVAHVDVVV